MVTKKDIVEMKQAIQGNHDAIIEWKPTMKRLNEIFKPEGKFDKLYNKVIRHDSDIKIHRGLIMIIIISILGLAWKVIGLIF